MRGTMIFMVSLSLKLYKSLGIDQCTLKDIFNDGFMNPRKEFTSPLILKGKLDSYFSYHLTNFISLTKILIYQVSLTIDYYLPHRPYYRMVLFIAQEAKQRNENFNTKVCVHYKCNVFYHDYIVNY